MLNFKNQEGEGHIKDLANLTEEQFDYINNRVRDFLQETIVSNLKKMQESEGPSSLEIELSNVKAAKVATNAAEELSLEPSMELAYVIGIIVITCLNKSQNALKKAMKMSEVGGLLSELIGQE